MELMKLCGRKMATPVPYSTFEQYAATALNKFPMDRITNPFLQCIAVPDSEYVLEPYFSLLTQNEKVRRDRFKHTGARLQFLTAHIALHLFLNQYLQSDYRYITIKETGHHKPFVELANGSRPLEFNLSHCKKWIALIVGSSPVGIDIEGHRQFDSMAGVADLVYTDSERSLIFKNEQQALHQFYRHWSCKEAFLKACGTGLMKDPKSLELDFQKEGCIDCPTVWWSDEIPGHSLAWTERVS